MASIDQNDGGAQQPQGCPSAKDLLDRITVELATFEAKKLGELKAELDAFVKKQDALVNEYKAKFPALRKLWCDRQLDLERLCAHIGCEFPLANAKVKALIEKCICTPLHDLCCQEQRIAARKRCCSGPKQRARDEAQAKFDAARKKLDFLTALAARIEGILGDNLKLVAEIEKVPPNERPVVLYLWLKLLRSHKHVAPYDAIDSCKKVCADWDLNTLCANVIKVACPDKDKGCKPPDGETTGGCSRIADPEGPSLINPDNYRNELDCAWQAYHEAKDALAQAEGELKKDPDDLDSLSKRLAEDTKALDDSIRKCLKSEQKPQGDCCQDAGATKKETY